MNIAIANKALENLEKNTKIKGEWVNFVGELQNVAGKVQLRFDEQLLADCYVEIKKEIRAHHIPRLRETAEKHAPFLLIVNRLYPNIKIKLREAHINWMDGAGNIYFENAPNIVWIDRHTTTPVTEKKNRAFTKTGLKVVFLFLQDEEWLNKTYREIAGAAGVALGNIKHVLDGLKAQRFLIKATENTYQLAQKEKLLDHWLTAFTDQLKPRIFIENFRFLKEEDERNWKQLPLDTHTFWGGEPAADLLTGNLKPGAFVLYTKKNKGEIMKDYKLRPDPGGNIEVYEPYWDTTKHQEPTAPPLTVYTDLMATGDPRNINIAREVHEKFLTHIT